MLKKSGKTRYKKTDKYRHNRCLMRHRKELGKHQGKCPVNSRYRPTKHPTWTSTKLGNDRRRLEQVSDGTGVAKEENGSTKEISLFFCLSECVCVCVCEWVWKFRRPLHRLLRRRKWPSTGCWSADSTVTMAQQPPNFAYRLPMNWADEKCPNNFIFTLKINETDRDHVVATTFDICGFHFLVGCYFFHLTSFWWFWWSFMAITGVSLSKPPMLSPAIFFLHHCLRKENHFVSEFVGEKNSYLNIFFNLIGGNHWTN